jgi:hypothetical protein
MTSADAWSDVADALRHKADADAGTAAGIRRTADGLYPDNSGHIVDGMHGMYMRDAIAVMDQSDLYQSMSTVVDEVAQLIYHARTQLDEIDRKANEKIEQLKAAAQGGGIGASLKLSALVSAIAAVVSAARAAAEALSASIAAEIAVLVARTPGMGCLLVFNSPSMRAGATGHSTTAGPHRRLRHKIGHWTGINHRQTTRKTHHPRARMPTQVRTQTQVRVRSATVHSTVQHRNCCQLVRPLRGRRRRPAPRRCRCPADRRED